MFVPKSSDLSLLDKSNSSTGAIRVEAYLPEHPISLHKYYWKCITRQCLTLKMMVKVMQYSIRNSPSAIPWPYHYRKTKTLHIFALAFTIFEILAFSMLDFENLGHGPMMVVISTQKKLQWCQSTSVRVLPSIFMLSFILSQILPSQMYNFANIYQDQDVQQSRWRHSIANTLLPVGFLGQ